MSKIEANKGFDFSPSRRHFLGMLGGAALVPVTGIKNAISQVLDLEANEGARRDIIIALQPSYWGKSGYNTPQTLRRILTSMGKVRGDVVLENINILGAKEFQFFKGTNEQIADQILRVALSYQSEFLQVQKKDESADGGGQYEQNDGVAEFEDNIRNSLAPVLRTFANKVQGPLTSTDSEGGKHFYHGRPNSVPNPYNDKHFFGTNTGKNISGTYINAQLEKYIGNKIPEFYEAGKITILASKIGGKNFLAVYGIDGNIKILTYVSIGTEEDPTHLPKLITKNVGEPGLIQMDKISVQAKGSSMWGGVHIRGGIYYHSSALGIDGEPKSHGCIRTPLLYLDGLHKIIKESPLGTQIDMRFENLY